MVQGINSNYTAEKAFGAEHNQSYKEMPARQKNQKDYGVILELGKQPEERVTYKKPVNKKPNAEEVNRLWEQARKSHESLRNLVEKLILKQSKGNENRRKGKEAPLIDNETRIEAQKAISEDGEYGIKAVSDRIVSFAIAISGDDTSKLAELKEAIEKGFEAAKEALGGSLPDICSKTYDEVMRKLDEWGQKTDKETLPA